MQTPSALQAAGIDELKTIDSGLRWSAIFHASIIILGWLTALVLPQNTTRFVPALRVDVVGLPDLLKADLDRIGKKGNAPKDETSPEEESPQAAVKVKPEDPTEEATIPTQVKVDPKKRKKKMDSALNRIRALERIKGEEDGDDRDLDDVVIKGNKISKGSSISGEAVEGGAPGYLDAIREQVKSNWSLPIWMSRQNLSAQALVFIDPSGKLQGLMIHKSSGNGGFDDAVKRAIQSSQPFPPPPMDLRKAMLRDGILLGFPL